MKKKNSARILSLVLIMLVFAVFCAFGFNFEANAEESIIRIGHVDWPGVTVKSHVVEEILTILGYKVDMKMLMLPVIFKGLDDGELDFFLGMWYPTQRPNFEPYKEKGTVGMVGVNLNETTYKLAVPTYVWEAGVKSIADLNKYSEKFDYKIIGIEPGNEGNQIMIDAIENNDYNLKDWELVEGSTSAMMAAVGRATNKQEWIVFLGWEPHWMNIEYDITYLEDPKKIWGENEVVYTIARSGFEEEMPNIYKFLTQFKVTPQIQNDWIYEYGNKKRDVEEVAREWIKDNLNVVDQWVYGVESVAGDRARNVIRSVLNN